MSKRTWKYIDGPVVHELTTFQGDSAVFALRCTGERVSKASYVYRVTTCIACMVQDSTFVGFVSTQEVGVDTVNIRALRKINFNW